MMTIFTAQFRECMGVRNLTIRPEERGLLAIARDAFAPQIVDMACERSRPRAVADYPGFYDDDPRACVYAHAGLKGGTLAASEP